MSQSIIVDLLFCLVCSAYFVKQKWAKPAEHTGAIAYQRLVSVVGLLSEAKVDATIVPSSDGTSIIMAPRCLGF